MTVQMKDEMTAQEIFDTVAAHLRKQKTRAMVGEGPSAVCAYRGKNGTMCAVGCLISDEIANLRNTNNVSLLIDEAEKVGIAVPSWLVRELSLLRSLQAVHDNSPWINLKSQCVPKRLERELKDVAAFYKLHYTSPAVAG